jgi:HlyD family secretion protein
MLQRVFHSPTIGIVVAIGATVISGCASDATATPKREQAKAIPVKTVSVTETAVERTTTQPATVHPYYRAEIRAKVSGYVREIKADIGDYVEADAVLAVIDVPEMGKQRQVTEARIARYESEESRAEAGVQLAQANVRSAKAKLEQSKSELSRAEASLAAMEAEFDRTQDLVQRQSLERRMLDEARKKRDSELANKQAMESAIHSAEADVAVAEARLTSAKADLRAAQAETSIARKELEEFDVLIAYATLKAPFAGIVTERSVDPGNLVREGSEVGRGEPLFVVSQIDMVRVQTPVPEADAAHVSRGDAVTLSFPSFPAEEHMIGAVTRVSGNLDPSTRTMLVEAEMANPDRKLIPGMFGQASISLSSKVAANMLPARAIRFDESGQAFVYAVDGNNIVSVVPVTTGLDNGHSIEVRSGVEPGQRVVDAHLKRLTDGQQVAPLDN